MNAKTLIEVLSRFPGELEVCIDPDSVHWWADGMEDPPVTQANAVVDGFTEPGGLPEDYEDGSYILLSGA